MFNFLKKLLGRVPSKGEPEIIIKWVEPSGIYQEVEIWSISWRGAVKCERDHWRQRRPGEPDKRTDEQCASDFTVAHWGWVESIEEVNGQSTRHLVDWSDCHVWSDCYGERRSVNNEVS